MQALPPPPQLASTSGGGGGNKDDFGLTPSILAMHLANLVLSKTLFFNPQLRVQTVAYASEYLNEEVSQVAEEEVVETEKKSEEMGEARLLDEEKGSAATAHTVNNKRPPKRSSKNYFVNGHSPLSVVKHIVAHGGGLVPFFTRGVAADLVLSIPCFANAALAHFLTSIAIDFTELAILRYGMAGGRGGASPHHSPPAEGSAAAGFLLLVINRALPSLVCSLTSAPRDTLLANLHCDRKLKRRKKASKNKEEEGGKDGTRSERGESFRYAGKISDTWACVQTLWRAGGVSSFYRGWWLAPVRAAAESTAYYGSFYAVAYCRARDAGPLPLVGEWAMAISAGLIGAIVAQPFNVVRTHVMLSAAVPTRNTRTLSDSADDASIVSSLSEELPTIVDGPIARAKYIITKQGVAGLWQGFGVTVFSLLAGETMNYLLG